MKDQPSIIHSQLDKFRTMEREQAIVEQLAATGQAELFQRLMEQIQLLRYDQALHLVLPVARVGTSTHSVGRATRTSTPIHRRSRYKAGQSWSTSGIGGGATSASEGGRSGAEHKEALAEGVLSAGVWLLLGNLDYPELRWLASALPAVVLSSRADSTTKKYLGAFQRWKAWADQQMGVPSFPIQDIHLALYMQHLRQSTQYKSAIEEIVYALAWLHRVGGLPSPSSSLLIQTTLERLQCMLAKPKTRKDPVMADMLKEMVEDAGSTPSLMEVRLLAVCLVAFAGFLHCNEITN